MTISRRLLIPEGEDGIYHCWSRCVRRAFLCGTDEYTGQCFDHRKEWIRERARFLASVFAIDPLSYGLMSNHQHLLLRVFSKLSVMWTPEEVARRWLLLCPKRREQDGSPSPASEEEIEEITKDVKRLAELRRRLGSVSWFMKSLNEFIARRANREDECTGAFWEGRFKCKRIEDEAALLVCSAYIDLNPIRAFQAKSPEESEFTSVQERIRSYQADGTDTGLWIAPVSKKDSPERGFLSMSLEEYLTVVDLTGRELQKEGTGRIPKELPPILTRLGIEPRGWRTLVTSLSETFSFSVGSSERLEERAEQMGRKWLRGVRLAREVFA